MRRLARIFLNAATAVSLILCVATVVLWVRSRNFHETLAYRDGTQDRQVREFVFWSYAGAVGIMTDAGWRPNGHGAGWCAESDDYSDMVGNAAAFRDDRASRTGRHLAGAWYVTNRDWSEAGIPTWEVLAALALLPAVRLLRAAAARRNHAVGYCRHCGYDLRATPGRCPECGMIPAR